tara:strand:- start:3387 stop:3737 length:351 start_codon:yes stop_codon:yes gene_type:complete
MTVRTIDLTPSWREVAKIIEIGLTCGTYDGKKMARDELHRMASIIDALKLMVDNLELERNELLAALKQMHFMFAAHQTIDETEHGDVCGTAGGKAITQARDAIAKVGEPLKGNDDE